MRKLALKVSHSDVLFFNNNSKEPPDSPLTEMMFKKTKFNIITPDRALSLGPHVATEAFTVSNKCSVLAPLIYKKGSIGGKAIFFGGGKGIRAQHLSAVN